MVLQLITGEVVGRQCVDGCETCEMRRILWPKVLLMAVLEYDTHRWDRVGTGEKQISGTSLKSGTEDRLC